MRIYFPVPESKFRMYVDFGGTSTKENSTTLNLVDVNDGFKSMKYFSGDDTTYTLGEFDNYNVGYKAIIDYINLRKDEKYFLQYSDLLFYFFSHFLWQNHRRKC